MNDELSKTIGKYKLIDGKTIPSSLTASMSTIVTKVPEMLQGHTYLSLHRKPLANVDHGCTFISHLQQSQISILFVCFISLQVFGYCCYK